MSIKPPSFQDRLNALPGGGVLRLSGRDALAFAQAQFANDVNQLEIGQWQWNLMLSPKGRVIAIFALVRVAEDQLLAWLPDYTARQLADYLLRFRFRSKLEISVLENASISGGFCAPQEIDADTNGDRATVSVDAQQNPVRVVLDLSGTSARCLLITFDGHTPADDATFTARWRLDDIAHGLPRLGEDQAEAFTPQMLGLERLNAFSVKKGCYPGQEIVARTHFLGKAKRTTMRVSLSQAADTGLRLESDSGANAQLVCSAAADDRIEGLIIAPLDSDEPFLGEGGVPRCSPLPLLDGLAR